MKRMQWLQETRTMRFEEAYDDWNEGRLSQTETERLLEVHERTFRRYINRYNEEGVDDLLDKRFTRVYRRHVVC